MMNEQLHLFSRFLRYLCFFLFVYTYIYISYPLRRWTIDVVDYITTQYIVTLFVFSPLNEVLSLFSIKLLKY